MTTSLSSTTYRKIYLTPSILSTTQNGTPPPDTTYDVYLGTDPDALELIAADISDKTYCPGCLETWTQYFWKVTAKNQGGQSEGPIWSFTTVCPVDLNRDGVVDVTDLDIFIGKWIESIMEP